MKNRLILLDQGFPTKNGGVGGSVRSGLELCHFYSDLYHTTMICSIENNLCKGIIPFKLYLSLNRNVYLRGVFKRISSFISLFYLISVKPDIVVLNNDVHTNQFIRIILESLTKIEVIQFQRSIYPLNYKRPPTKLFGVSELSVSNFLGTKFLLPNILGDLKLKSTLRSGRFEFVYLGRVLPKKGLKVIIEYVNRLGYELHIHGDFSDAKYRTELLEYISTREYNVVFHKWENDPLKKYNGQKCIITHFSSRANPEPFGRVYVEGILRGIPVLSWGNAGALELDAVKNYVLNYDIIDSHNLEREYQKVISSTCKVQNDLQLLKDSLHYGVFG